MRMEQGGYTTDAGGGDQGSYDYGGGGDFVYGYGAGGDSFVIDPGFGMDAGEPIDYAPGFEEIPYAPYEQSWELEPFVPIAETIATSEPGLIPYVPYEQSWEIEPFVPDIGLIETIPTSEPGLIPYAPYQQLWPIEGPRYFELPLPPVLESYVPLVSPPIPPQVTQPPTVPGSGQIPKAPGLPPACPPGYYHKYPIGDPRQNQCDPFPPAQVSKSPVPIPAGAQSGSKPPAQQQPRPGQQQQACPTGYCNHPQTGQCLPIPQGYFRHPTTQVCSPRCTTPGTVYDQVRGQCVPVAQAVNPLSGSEAPGTQLPSELTGLFGDLKNIPWWLWIAGLGALLLLGKDDDGRKTTVVHKRSS